MPYDRSYVYLRIQGHFGTATAFNDYWSVGMKLANASGNSAPTAGLAGFLAGIKSAVQTFHSASGNTVGNAVYLTRLSAARIGSDGKYDPDTQDTTIDDYVTPVPGGGTTNNAWSNALVTSLRTSRPRGLASNGRIYYPYTGGSVVASSGRILQATVTTWITNMKTLIDVINAQGATLSPAVKLHVMSKGANDGQGPGLSAAVVTIRADGRIDSQERREDNTPSTWSTASII